ncbi:hypothetical protein [Caballeronia sp. Lep1P3]|uniref:hypothetical protein n=1 Tax=Caballeronia sp. Lep1P3 TaxID=2878150 RepID=UPI001FD626E6|nr:hypothetical protein [Caballeronia sp. Lep1P3]
MSKPPRGIARFDSAAGMVQALAASLKGERFESPSQSPVLDSLMPALNQLPPRAREWAYSVGGMTEGIAARAARRLDIEGIGEWIAGLYPRRTYDAAFIGSSNGALMHVAAALGVPWLPQTFLCPVRAPFSDPDDAERGFRDGLRIVEALLDADSRIAVHHMQDPNQDRLMLAAMSYFRLKLRAMPLAYREFLLRSLAPNATIYVDACTRDWPVTRTSERSVYQFGALGGATEAEYFEGGPRVAAYLRRYGSRRSQWTPPAPTERAPEAEWGFDAALTESIVALAKEKNWRVVELRFEEPESFSFVAARLYRDWYRSMDIEARRLVVDSFVLMDPYTTMRLRAIPFWLVFCTEPSAKTLRRFLGAESFDEIDMMLFSHGTEGVGVTGIDEWRSLIDLSRKEGRFLGVDTRRYPRDFATFARFDRALARLGPQSDLPARLSVSAFEAGVRAWGAEFGVEVGDV